MSHDPIAPWNEARPIDQLKAEVERLQRIEKAADRVANWDQRRIVPTEECPNLATAIHLLREELAAVGGDPE